MRNRILAAALVLPAAVLAMPAPAQAQAVTDVVRGFLQRQTRDLGDEVRIQVREPRVQLPPCENPRPFLPAHGRLRPGRVAVGVHCGSDSRTRYLQAHIAVIARYLVAARDIAAGTTIAAGSLDTETGDLSTLPRDTVHAREAAVGRIATRPLATGAVIRHQQLRDAYLVRRRQDVTLVVRGQGFRITREGEALESGAKGETVRVRLSNREIVTGRIAAGGRVLVAP